MTGRLAACSDRGLARAAARGDQAAFAELACRYHGLIVWASRRPVGGLTREDLRQAALVGLFAACRVHDPRRGAFGSVAAGCVVNHVRREQERARSGKQRVLTEAVALDARDDGRAGDGESFTLVERLPAHDGGDPALVVEAREHLAAISAALCELTPKYRAALLAEDEATAKLRWLARRRLQQLLDRPPLAPKPRTTTRQPRASARQSRAAAPRQRAIAPVQRAVAPPQPAQAPRFTPAQIERAVRLVRAGASVGHAAFVVGADRKSVRGWLSEAA